MKYLFFILLTILFSCGDSTTTGNPQVVTLNISPYSATPLMAKLNRRITSMAVSNLSMCFKRIRFKPTNSVINENIDFEIGYLNIPPSGIELGDIEVSLGTFDRIEIDLESDCNNTGENSITFTNDNGTFNSSDRISLKFEGEFSTINENINLALQNIINTLNSYDGSTNLKDEIENQAGGID